MSIYASVDLGGTNIAVALGRSDGEIVAADSVSTESHLGPDGVLDRIATLVARLREQTQLAPEAVGLAVPGLCDPATGVTKFLPNMPTKWRDVPVGTTLAKQLGCPVRLLNDVRTATLGELKYGHGRRGGTMAFFSIGTGIGGGLAIDGQLYLGRLGAAGEMGHQTILPQGPRCGCGNRGCLETLASGPAIIAAGVRLMLTGLAPELHRLVQGDSAKVNPAVMLKAAEAGDESVSEVLDQAAEYLGIGVANVVVTVHPHQIVLGGGVAQLGSRLTTIVQRVVRERVGMLPTDDIEVKLSELGDRAGVLGGIALAMSPSI